MSKGGIFGGFVSGGDGLFGLGDGLFGFVGRLFSFDGGMFSSRVGGLERVGNGS